MHKAWSSIEEVPYCFSMSYVKFQGHTALKIVEFDPNLAFLDCNSSLNSLAVTKFKTMCFVIFPLNAGKVLPIILYWFQSQHMEICKIYNRLKSMHTLKVITNNYDSHAIRRSWCLSLNTTTYDFVSAGLAYLLFRLYNSSTYGFQLIPFEIASCTR